MAVAFPLAKLLKSEVTSKRVGVTQSRIANEDCKSSFAPGLPLSVPIRSRTSARDGQFRAPGLEFDFETL